MVTGRFGMASLTGRFHFESAVTTSAYLRRSSSEHLGADGIDCLKLRSV